MTTPGMINAALEATMKWDSLPVDQRPAKCVKCKLPFRAGDVICPSPIRSDFYLHTRCLNPELGAINTTAAFRIGAFALLLGIGLYIRSYTA